MTTASATPPTSRTGLSREPSPPTLMDVISSPPFIGLAGLIALGFVSVFLRWLVKQNELSLDKLEDWGHAYVIPLISGYMIWTKREELLRTTPTVYWPGLVPMVLGLVCYYYFIVGIPNHMFQGFSMILALFGLVLLLLGPGPMRVLFVPIAFLVFGVTVAERVMIEITFQLKLIAAYGSWLVLSLIGAVFDFTVELQGTSLSIDTGGGVHSDLDVADACSGMRMVIAFVALAATVALFSCRHWWQRTALVLLAVPVAVLMNILRVTLLGLTSLANKNFAAGDMHMMLGMLTLVPGLALFMGVVWALNRAVKDGPVAPQPAGPVRLAPPDWRALRQPALLACLAVLAVSAAGMSAAITQGKIFLSKKAIYPPNNRQLHDIKARSLSWERAGTDHTASKEEEEALGTQNYVTRKYARRASDKPVVLDFHAAYYTKQVDTVPHVPERCFVAGGLQMVKEWGDVPVPLDRSRWREAKDVPDELKGHIVEAPVINEVGAVSTYVRLPRDPETLKLHVTEFAGRGQRVMSGYFFIANGGVVARANDVRLLAFNLTDSYSYYVKVQVSSATATTGEELAAEAGALLNDLLPEIMLSVPDWVEVVRGDYPPDNPARAARAGP